MNDYQELRDCDLRRIWHPYTKADAMEADQFPIIDRAEGVYLYDVRGRKLLDGISSWWCVNLGHSHPHIVEAIRRQAERLQHSVLGGMSHPPVIRLADELLAIAPDGLSRAYFASDGASANEAAMRMALQYWANLGKPERSRFVSLADGYHGDTLGTVGVGYVDAFHHSIRHAVTLSFAADSPHCFHCPCGKQPGQCQTECFGSMQHIFDDHGDEIAAVILEPLCQGAAGMRIYPADYLRRLRTLCDQRNVLMIADEIAVGFGRTGSMFACEQAGICPDFLVIGKGLTGGMLPMSAVLTSEKIFDAFRNTDGADRTFYHGHTYCGNPIASAAALAAIQTYRDEQIVPRSAVLAGRLAEAFEQFRSLPGVANTATMGTMTSLEISAEAGGPASAKQIAAAAMEAGLFIRPLGAILYLWPPLTTTPAELERMLDLFEQALTS